MRSCRHLAIHCPHGRAGLRERRGFTLVELLVVVAIVAVLLGILLASLSKARESARSVKCLGNLHSLGMAMQSYVQRYERFPRSGLPGSAEDWFHFTNMPPHKRTRGGIAEFLDDGGPTTSSVWMCPSDDPDAHLMRAAGNVAAYPYSYSVNFVICTYFNLQWVSGGRLNEWPTTLDSSGRRARTMSLSQVKQPESKILIIDENSDVADDGCWAWMWDGGQGRNMLSNRHDRRKEATTNLSAGTGNAAFVDGHAERIPRIKSVDPKYYDPFLPGGSLLPPPTVPQAP
jgi:prepilin-type N-terminal cleavage/methylation domain-containing protein/prepilin-type processing-associated H-X9-DG protein